MNNFDININLKEIQGITPFEMPSGAVSNDDVKPLFENEETDNSDGFNKKDSSEEAPPEKESGYAASLNDEDRALFIRSMEFVIKQSEKELKTAKDNNGIIAGSWDGIKNAFGMEYGSDAVQGRIDALKEKIEGVKNGELNLSSVYKEVTGNELNEDELENILNPKVSQQKDDGIERPKLPDYSKSETKNDVQEYKAGQKDAVDTAAAITSGIAIAASPFSMGTSAVIGLGSYMAVEASDGLTEKDGYSKDEIIEDLAHGAVSAGANLTGIKAAGAAGKVLGNFAAAETAGAVIGAGNAGGSYIADTLTDDNTDFSLNELGKRTAIGAAGGLAAGSAAYGANAIAGSLVNSGSTAASNIAGRMLSGGISGAAAGSAGSFASNSTAYIMDCLDNDKEITFSGIMEAGSKNIGAGAIAGLGTGIAFSAVQLTKGMPKPDGTKTSKAIKMPDGSKCRLYLDETGKPIALDGRAQNIKNALSSKEGLVKYGNDASLISENARTVRLTFQYSGNSASAEVSQLDWAGNTKTLGHTKQYQLPAQSLESGAQPAAPALNSGAAEPQIIDAEFIDYAENKSIMPYKGNSAVQPFNKSVSEPAVYNPPESSIMPYAENSAVQPFNTQISAAAVSANTVNAQGAGVIAAKAAASALKPAQNPPEQKAEIKPAPVIKTDNAEPAAALKETKNDYEDRLFKHSISSRFDNKTITQDDYNKLSEAYLSNEDLDRISAFYDKLEVHADIDEVMKWLDMDENAVNAEIQRLNASKPAPEPAVPKGVCSELTPSYAWAQEHPGANPMDLDNIFDRMMMPLRCVDEGNILITVDMDKYISALEESGNYIGSGGGSEIGSHLSDFEDFLKTGKDIAAPYGSFSESGGKLRFDISNGRHRTEVLRRMGMNKIKLSVSPESAKLAEKYGLTAD